MDRREHVIYSRLARWLFRGLTRLTSGREMAAVTLFRRTFYFIDARPFDSDFTAIRLHEAVHRRQQAKQPLLFYPRYVWYAITRGYDHNPYEIEASEAEGWAE